MRSPPTACLAKNSSTTSTIDTPIVTTVTMSRGACEKRRIDGDLGGRAEQRGAEDDDRQHGEVGHAALGDQQQRDDRGHRAELGLGEVDDAVAPVDEDQAHRHERVQRAEHHAVGDHLGRDRAGAAPDLDDADVDAEHRRQRPG